MTHDDHRYAHHVVTIMGAHNDQLCLLCACNVLFYNILIQTMVIETYSNECLQSSLRVAIVN
jgi:hypothetical protein